MKNWKSMAETVATGKAGTPPCNVSIGIMPSGITPVSAFKTHCFWQVQVQPMLQPDRLDHVD